MLLNDLDTTLRNAGLAVTEASGWVGHNHGAMTSVECIVIHHTAGAATGDYPSYNVVRNGRSDLAGPLAQLGCGRSGRMYVFSNGVAWHAGATLQPWMDNFHAIGIEVESTGTGVEWPLVQTHAAAKAAAALCRKYGVPSSRVLGHKEICSPPGRKVDPVGIIGDMRGFRSLVQYYINNPQGENDMEATELAKDPGPGKWGWVWLRAQQQADALRNYVEDAIIPGVSASRSEATNAKTAANQANAKGDQALAKLDALSTKVDALGNGGVNVDALAAQVAAQLGPVIGQVVADEVARRLAN
jgi:hypothetical protein